MACLLFSIVIGRSSRSLSAGPPTDPVPAGPVEGFQRKQCATFFSLSRPLACIISHIFRGGLMFARKSLRFI